MENCDVAEQWAVIDGGGKHYLFVAIQKKAISQLLPGFTSAMAHQSK